MDSTAPVEIIGAILAFLPTHDLLQCHLVCAEWKSIARPLLISNTPIVLHFPHDPLKAIRFERYLFRLQRFFENQSNFRYVRSISVNGASFTFHKPLCKEPSEPCDKDGKNNLVEWCQEWFCEGSILASHYVGLFISKAAPYITSLTFELDFFGFFSFRTLANWTFPSLPALTGLTIHYVPGQPISEVFPLLGTSTHLKSLECSFGTIDFDVTEHSFELRSLSLINTVVPAKLPSLSNLKSLCLHPAAWTPSELGNITNLLQLASPTLHDLDLLLPPTRPEHRNLLQFPFIFIACIATTFWKSCLHFHTSPNLVCLNRKPSTCRGCDFSYSGLSTLFNTKRSLIVLHVNPVSTVELMDLLRFASDFEGYLSLSDVASTNNALLDLPSSVLSLCLSILGASGGCLLSFNGKEDTRVWLAFADIIGQHSFPGIKGYSIGSNAEMLEVKTQEGKNAIQALQRELEKQNVPLELFVEFKEDDTA
ncbi:hypothetical protein BT69DRAFT_1285554 [Atractiella rhizophila]|nr:hypothetical protein BT69DRAFT_1285554 [Atractiella rhizophila]